MLHERCAKLEERIKEYKQLRAANDAVAAYETRLTQIKTEADRLRSLMKTREVLLQHMISIYAVGENASRIQPRLLDLRDRYRAEPSVIIPQQALGTMLRELSQVANRLHERLSSAWQAHTAPMMIDVPDTFLALFDQVPEARNTVQRIRALRGQLSAMASRLPTTEQDITNVHSSRAKLHTLVRELQGFPPAVLAFLRAAASGGAELDLLTDEVCQWLTEKEMKSAFRINTRQTA